jgi:hypothetical protein
MEDEVEEDEVNSLEAENRMTRKKISKTSPRDRPIPKTFPKQKAKNSTLRKVSPKNSGKTIFKF